MAARDGVIARAQMGQAELEQVARLVGAVITHDRIDPRINWSALTCRTGDAPSDLLCYRDGQLVGFLALDGLGDEEAEAAALVHPEQRRRGVFRALVAAARTVCAAAGTATLTLVADRASPAARPTAAALGASRTHAEHKMMLEKMRRKQEAIPFALDFAPATEADAPAIAQIIAADEGDEAGSLVGFVTLMMQRPEQRYFVARHAGAPVGTLRIEQINDERYIYGFVVAPSERGKGYGREILARTLQHLFAGDDAPIFLEVDESNTPALSLYHSLGFQTICTYDYYRLPTTKDE